MSKRLGDNYINERTKKWHTSNLHNHYYLPLTDGKKASIPRYYKDKIYAQEQRKAIGALKRIEMETNEPISHEELRERVIVNQIKLRRMHSERTCNNFH